MKNAKYKENSMNKSNQSTTKPHPENKSHPKKNNKQKLSERPHCLKKKWSNRRNKPAKRLQTRRVPLLLPKLEFLLQLLWSSEVLPGSGFKTRTSPFLVFWVHLLWDLSLKGNEYQFMVKSCYFIYFNLSIYYP